MAKEKETATKRNRRRCKTLEARKILEGLACDPLAGMALIAADEEVDVKLRAKLYMELAQYIHPKKRAPEQEEGQDGETYEERLRRIRGIDD